VVAALADVAISLGVPARSLRCRMSLRVNLGRKASKETLDLERAAIERDLPTCVSILKGWLVYQ
jgi:hypothetical protein